MATLIIPSPHEMLRHLEVALQPSDDTRSAHESAHSWAPANSFPVGSMVDTLLRHRLAPAVLQGSEHANHGREVLSRDLACVWRVSTRVQPAGGGEVMRATVGDTRGPRSGYQLCKLVTDDLGNVYAEPL